MSTVIKVENLSKHYRLGLIGGKTLRDDLNRWWARVRKQPDPLLKIGQEERQNGNGEYIWALRDINFEVQQGEIVGIIGRNGAGKSTLLKILSRITAPTSGQVKVKGRIASLLEVGTGFHPELTGRENIYLNGAILGMKKAEIDRKFDEIVAFAEVEKFIDTPVKRYSSGMYVRLAFAVAAHLEPEILVVDEVLAVGDAAFQKKCLGKMGEVAGEGKTVLLVSHNMGVIQKLCDCAFLLKQGTMIAYGETFDIVADYLSDGGLVNVTAVVNADDHPNRLSRMRPIIGEVSLYGEDGEPKTDYNQDEVILLQMKYDATKVEVNLAGAGLILETHDGLRVGAFNSYMASKPPHRIPSKGTVEFLIKKPRLNPGRYCLTVSMGSHQGVLEDKIERILAFDVHAADIYDTGYLLTREDGVIALECEFRSLEL